MPQSKQKTIYRTNIGNHAYIIVRTGSENNKRFHVVANPQEERPKIVYSGPDFGESCERLFLDGHARMIPQIMQKKLQPKQPYNLI